MPIDDNGKGARRERYKGMVDGLGVIECATTAEPRRDRVSVGDDTHGEHGACGVHGSGSGGDARRRSGTRRH